MSEIVSKPYAPNSEYCCEACVFGRGEHAEWCDRWAQFLERMRKKYAEPAD